MKKSMLYLMAIDWGWIAQRPQFLALELNAYFELKVVYPKTYLKRWKTQKHLDIPANNSHYIYLPFPEKLWLSNKILDLTQRKAMGNVDEFDYVWITTPEQYDFITNYKGIVIYDCMDNYSAMRNNAESRKKVCVNHLRLLERADICFASSEKLFQDICEKRKDKKTELIRNGYLSNRVYKPRKIMHKQCCKLGYIGTISSWFDFEALEKSIKEIANIEYHLIGPRYECDDVNNKMIHFEGVIEHDRLFDKIKDYCALIMPFKLNDIVLAVDPVKLYEYICFGKCIVSVYYPEIERFSDFVYFYKTSEEYVNLIKWLYENDFPTKYDSQMQEEFINNNSWNHRIQSIMNYIQMEEEE